MPPQFLKIVSYIVSFHSLPFLFLDLYQWHRCLFIWRF